MSGVTWWFLTAPIWLIGTIIYVGMIVAAYVGWRLRWHAATPESERAQREEGYAVSAVMSLLALLVGFTFALAVDRYDTRREMVLAEANAIGTAYLRTQLLPEPHRMRLSQLLRDYTDNRLVLAAAGRGEEQTRRLAKSDELVMQLWTATVAAFPSIQTRPLSSAYIQSMNDLIDMDAARQQSRRSHVPPMVFIVLLIYQFIAAGVLGYVLVGHRGRTTASLLLLLFGGALILVIDIDRPTGGGVVEDQQPMLLLRDMIHDHPPSSFGAGAGPDAPSLGAPSGARSNL